MSLSGLKIRRTLPIMKSGVYFQINFEGVLCLEGRNLLRLKHMRLVINLNALISTTRGMDSCF